MSLNNPKGNVCLHVIPKYQWLMGQLNGMNGLSMQTVLATVANSHVIETVDLFTPNLQSLRDLIGFWLVQHTWLLD